MFVKSFALAAPLLLGGLWAGGAFGGGDYTRTVGRPEAEVMTALAQLSLAEQPGAVGTDPSRSGGVPSIFRLDRTDHAMVWTVMSGDRVATRLTAEFKPVSPTETKVTAHVERGDAPDDVVAPAFRSPRVTLQVFSMALNGQLDSLTGPATADLAGCRALLERMENGEFGDRGAEPPATLGQAIGHTALTGLKLGQIDAEQRRLGCDKIAGGWGAVRRLEPSGAPLVEHMVRGDNAPAGRYDSDRRVSFVPGKPMIDPRPGE